MVFLAFAQEMDPEQAAGMVAGIMGLAFGLICIGLLVGLGIQAVICYFVWQLFNAIPEAHRKQQPGLVWLLMIPCFNLVWNFFVFPKLSESFQSYFLEKGRTEFGDCNRQLAYAYCICGVACLIPYVNYLAGLAALVLLILYLVKAFEFKGKM